MKNAILRFEGIGEWHGRSVYLVRGEKGEDTVTIALDPESREVLGLSLARGKELSAKFLAEGIPIEEEAPREFAYSPPAKTPLEAGLLAALAFGTGDGELLDRIVHWSTVFAAFRVANPKVEVTQEQLRATVCGRLSRYANKAPRAILISLLESIASNIAVTMDGKSRARISFPEAFRNLSLNVVKVGDFWCLAELSG